MGLLKNLKPNSERQLKFLQEITNNLCSPIDLEVQLQTIIDAAISLSESEAGSILLYDEEIGLLEFVAAPREHRQTLKRVRVPLDNSIAGWVFKEGKPLIIPYANDVSQVYREVDQVLNFQTRSILAVPMKFQEKTIGVMDAVNKQSTKEYSDNDLSILQTLADQATIAIQNAQLQEDVIQSKNELFELDRLKSKFIAIVSHELRTPLGLIIGHSTYLKEIINDESRAKQLDTIVKSAGRIKQIIEDLENVDHVDAGKSRVRRKRVAINELIQEVLLTFQLSAKRKNLSLEHKLSINDIHIEGDEEKLTIALSNLVKNSINFTDDGGRIAVTSERLPGYVKISVIDNGIGIPAQEINRVFDRFYQVEGHLTRQHGGMGMGLSVAKVMIELHGGQIWAESNEGIGSNFSILLPASPQQNYKFNKVFTE